MTDTTPPPITVDIWLCFGCRDYGKVFDNSKRTEFCGKCGHKKQFQTVSIAQA